LTDSYMKNKKQREEYEEQKGEIIFGFFGGTVILLAGIMNSWPVYGSLNLYAVVSLVFIAIGLCLLLIGFIAPALLKLPYKCFVFIGKKFGEAVLLIFLAVIYFIMVIPVGFILRRKRRSLGFFTWNGDYPYEEKAFEKIRTDGGKDINSTIKSPFLKNIYNFFGTLVRNKRAVLIPAAIVLVIIGLILFFAASNIIFNFFIYTLF